MWLNPILAPKADQLHSKFAGGRPFPHLVLNGFFSDRIQDVADALLKERFIEQNSDLFQFQQTDDCKNASQPVLRDFYSFFSSSDFIGLISRITGVKLESIDMSGFIYDDTDYLLPHDDRLEGRKVAYILNLSKDFTNNDGGALRFFDKKRIVKSIVPSFNTFTIFKVSSKSIHQVQEVVSDKKRLSLAGWFHG